ncbi:MAG: hypothetical protein GY861_03835 [bacterium]|nr:hypothetical protein [bacterium]
MSQEKLEAGYCPRTFINTNSHKPVNSHYKQGYVCFVKNSAGTKYYKENEVDEALEYARATDGKVGQIFKYSDK